MPEIVEKGRELFLKHIARPPIQSYVHSAVLNLLHVGRDGYPVNCSPVRKYVDMLLQLDAAGLPAYESDLELAVLRESTIYYKTEGQKLLETCNAPEYLRRVRPFVPAVV